MWNFFSHSPTRPVSLEDRLKTFNSRLHAFIYRTVESVSQEEKTDLINSPEIVEPMNGLLTTLLEEDAGLIDGGEEFGPGMEWVLEQGLFDQFAALAQLDKPTGLFAKILSFLTLLIIDIRHQPLIQHMGFNRSLTTLLFVANERLRRGLVFVEAKEAAIPLIHAICGRVTENPSLSNFFLTRDEERTTGYMLVPVLEYFLENEKREDASSLECLIMIGQVEDLDVATYLINESQLMQIVAHRLVSYVSKLPKTGRKLSYQTVKSRELDEVCKYVSFLDSFCWKCIHPGLIRVLTSSLLSDCFRPYIAPSLQSAENDTRTLFTIYLLHILNEMTSKDLLMVVARMIRNSDQFASLSSKQESHSRLESISTMVSSALPTSDVVPRVKSHQTTIWEAFIDNLQSPNTGLELASLKLLYRLLEKKEWSLVEELITDLFVGDPANGLSHCSYERFFSNFPASLLYTNAKSMTVYYSERMNQVLSSSLPSFTSFFSSPSFMVSRTSEPEFYGNLRVDCEEKVRFSKELYGSEKVEGAAEFDEGPILRVLLRKLEMFLKNTVEENLLISGIFSRLCTFPALNSASFTLYSLLLSPNQRHIRTMFSILKTVKSYCRSTNKSRPAQTKPTTSKVPYTALGKHWS